MRQIKCQVASCHSEIVRIIQKIRRRRTSSLFETIIGLKHFPLLWKIYNGLSSCQNYGCAINACSEEEHLKFTIVSNEEFYFSAQISTLGYSRRSWGRCPIWPFIGETRGSRPRRIRRSRHRSALQWTEQRGIDLHFPRRPQRNRRVPEPNNFGEKRRSQTARFRVLPFRIGRPRRERVSRSHRRIAGFRPNSLFQVSPSFQNLTTHFKDQNVCV